MAIEAVEELRTVMRIAELGSLSAAATARGESTNAVSRRLRTLEERLGVPLFHRTTRRVALTDEGHALCAGAPRVLAELEALEAAVASRPARLRGLVRVGLRPELVDGRWFDGLRSLLAAHPDLEVQLLVAGASTPHHAGLDLWFHFGRPRASALVARRLGAAAWGLAAAPSYAARRGLPRAVDELADHHCLRALREGREHRWTLVDSRGKEHHVAVGGQLESDDPHVLAAALYGGLGIGLRPAPEIAREERAGRLVPVLPGFRSWSVAIYLLSPRARARLPRVRLVAALMAEVGRSIIDTA
jgi:DNA-binding transcriptional LysR family regulator